MRILLKKIRLFIIGCLLLIVTVTWVQQVFQPVRYNHKIHIDEAGLECMDCHINAETQSRALIPNINICADCHEGDESENENIIKVAEFINNGVKIPWQQIHSVPDYVFFSHRRHVVLAEIECSACHGQVAVMKEPFSKPAMQMDMEWCMNCHEQQKVSNDCYTCHR